MQLADKRTGPAQLGRDLDGKSLSISTGDGCWLVMPLRFDSSASNGGSIRKGIQAAKESEIHYTIRLIPYNRVKRNSKLQSGLIIINIIYYII